MGKATRFRMPSAKQRRLVDLRERAYNWMLNELFDTIDSHRSLLPSEDDCLRLILSWWALTDEQSRNHSTYLTAFQFWRQQRQGVLFKEDPDLYYPLNTSQREDACNDPKDDVDPARRVLASRSLDEQHALLNFALDVLRDSDTYADCLAYARSGRHKPPIVRLQATKQTKGKTSDDLQTRQEKIDLYLEWRAAYATDKTKTKEWFEDARKLPSRIIERGRYLHRADEKKAKESRKR
jgi:hypothetical protein